MINIKEVFVKKYASSAVTTSIHCRQCIMKCKRFEITENIINKSTQRAQISAKAAHYPHISQIHDSESEHGDPDHSQNLINCSLHQC